jgi:hypothetical protein
VGSQDFGVSQMGHGAFDEVGERSEVGYCPGSTNGWEVE